jgi:hypothetical protein
MLNNQQEIIGAVRIGNGEKLHPAYKDRYGLTICCRCAGTRSGSANQKAVFYANKESNCRK